MPRLRATLLVAILALAGTMTTRADDGDVTKELPSDVTARPTPSTRPSMTAVATPTSPVILWAERAAVYLQLLEAMQAVPVDHETVRLARLRLVELDRLLSRHP